jgi:small redox-active disulfide protein 2
MNYAYFCKKIIDIKILGAGCAKCKTTYNNVLEALKETGVEATITKIEDLEEMMQYNVLTTPVLMINNIAVVKGRVAEVSEIKSFLQ